MAPVGTKESQLEAKETVNVSNPSDPQSAPAPAPAARTGRDWVRRRRDARRPGVDSRAFGRSGRRGRCRPPGCRAGPPRRPLLLLPPAAPAAPMANPLTGERIAIDDFMKVAELWPAMGELGLHGITVDEEYGGLGLGYLEHVIAREEVSRASASIGLSYGAHSNLCVNQIRRWGSRRAEGEIPAQADLGRACRRARDVRGRRRLATSSR